MARGCGTRARTYFTTLYAENRRVSKGDKDSAGAESMGTASIVDEAAGAVCIGDEHITEEAGGGIRSSVTASCASMLRSKEAAMLPGPSKEHLQRFLRTREC